MIKHKPKYEIGQAVMLNFEGEIEGVPVKVSRTVFVIAICITTNGYHDTPCCFSYTLAERFPSYKTTSGKTWGKLETEIIPMEPVVGAIQEANATA